MSDMMKSVAAYLTQISVGLWLCSATLAFLAAQNAAGMSLWWSATSFVTSVGAVVSTAAMVGCRIIAIMDQS